MFFRKSFTKKKEELLNLLSEESERVSLILASKKLDIGMDEAFRLCLALADEGLLSVRYEITCPNCASDVLVVDDLAKVPRDEITCDVCGHNFTPELGDIWITVERICSAPNR